MLTFAYCLIAVLVCALSAALLWTTSPILAVSVAPGLGFAAAVAAAVAFATPARTGPGGSHRRAGQF
ncbi:MAG TPA: hypothetical protein VGU45_09990 [Microvirga sp.]|jgi:hypothetical protein|nr:hypothetical protein [Microvirga sp.]